MSLTFIPLRSPTRLAPFNLAEAVMEALGAAGQTLQDGDILVVSSKFAAIAEGRVVTLADVQPTPRAHELAAQYHLTPALAQLVLQESEHIFGGIAGFLLSVKDNLIAPNAGIDSSNVPEGQVVLYPAAPFDSAEKLRAALSAQTGRALGVVLSDSRLMVGRTGTTGVAIGVAGFPPVQDERGKPDLLGKPLKVSQKASADNLCAGAQLLMGEAAEGLPIVLVRGAGLPMTGDAPYTWRDLAIAWREDLYVAIMGVG